MLSNATNKVVGHADVERASDTIGQNVNVEAACRHRLSVEYWVARSSRAMTAMFTPPPAACAAAETARARRGLRWGGFPRAPRPCWNRGPRSARRPFRA